MPNISCTSWSYSTLAWAFKFLKFHVLERNYKMDLVQTKTNLWRMTAFRCIQMCDHGVCISLHYTPSLHKVFCFSTSAFCLDRDYFVAFKIMTRSVILLLQFRPYGTDFITFFLWHCESRKQQYQPSSILWRLAS